MAILKKVAVQSFSGRCELVMEKFLNKVSFKKASRDSLCNSRNDKKEPKKTFKQTSFDNRNKCYCRE